MLLLFPAGKETGRCGHSLPHSLTSLGGSLQARKAAGSLEGLMFLIPMLQPEIVWKFSRYQTFLT